MLYHRKLFLIFCLISSSISLTSSVEGPIITEQNSTGLSLPALIVQIITEPENLIRLFEGLDLGLQMFRSWGKAGAALMSLPRNKELLRGGFDPFTLGPHHKFYYARVPTRNAHEAPRFIKMSHGETHRRFNLNPIDPVHRLFYRKKDEVPFSNYINTDLPSHATVNSYNILSNHVRRRRSTTEGSSSPSSSSLTLSSILPLLLKRPALNKEQIEWVVDFLNKALGFLDEYAEAL